jgi:hypothetical protein
MSSEEELSTERVADLKKRRAVAKKNVTQFITKVNAAIEAKEDPNITQLSEIFETFKDVHFKLVKLITDEDELDVANTYFEKVAQDVLDTERRVQSLKKTRQDPTAASTSKMKSTSTAETDTTARMSFGLSGFESMHIISETIKSILNESRMQQKEIVNSINTPRVEIMKFDGNPLKYYPFMRSFQNTVAARTQDNTIRLDTLIQHCTGDVNDLLQCCLLKDPDEGYALALEMLKETYGDHDSIATAWIDKLLNRPKLKSVKDLRKYANDLKTCHETLDAVDYLQELQTRTHLRAIADKLPDHIYNRWAKKSYSIREKEGRPGNLKELMKFIDRVSREASDPTFPTKEIDETSKPRKQSYATDSTEPETSIRKPLGYSCRKCSASHYLNQCDRFRALTVAERIEFLKVNELCLNCFQADHPTETCPRSWRCNIEGCGAKHNRWIHTSRPISGDQSTNYHGMTMASNTHKSRSVNFINARLEPITKPEEPKKEPGSRPKKEPDQEVNNKPDQEPKKEPGQGPKNEPNQEVRKEPLQKEHRDMLLDSNLRLQREQNPGLPAGKGPESKSKRKPSEERGSEPNPSEREPEPWLQSKPSDKELQTKPKTEKESQPKPKTRKNPNLNLNQSQENQILNRNRTKTQTRNLNLNQQNDEQQNINVQTKNQDNSQNHTQEKNQTQNFSRNRKSTTSFG